MGSIFEEHHMCHTSSQLSSEQFCNAETIYVQEENVFIFNNVVVGQTAQARFKLTNDGKVPCIVKLSIRYPRAKVMNGTPVWAGAWMNAHQSLTDVIHPPVFIVVLQTSSKAGGFVLSAATLNIPSQSHSYAVVNFKPQRKKLNSAAFEATIEAPDRYSTRCRVPS